jgi:hypothetical protein
MSPLQAFLLVAAGILCITVHMISERLRAQAVTREWMRYLRDSMPAYPVLPTTRYRSMPPAGNGPHEGDHI